MQTWAQYSSQRDVPVCFRLTGLWIIPTLLIAGSQSDIPFVSSGSCENTDSGGSNGQHRWRRQNETQVEELNSYNKGNASKHLNFKEDLGSQRLCCSRNLNFCQTGNAFISARKINLCPSSPSSFGIHSQWGGFPAFLQRVSKLTSC